VNGKSQLYCHKLLFFNRIPIIDIQNNKDLLDIYTETTCIYDITSLKIKDEKLLDIIEMLYLGCFINNRFTDDYLSIIDIFKKLGFQRMVRYLSSYLYATLNTSRSLDSVADHKDKPILHNENLIFSYINEENRNNEIVLRRVFINTLPFRSKTLFLMLHQDYENTLCIIPSDILRFIMQYTLCDQILSSEFHDITTLINLLYFSDFLCYDSLINVKYNINKFKYRR
jgi:hypothetical protein